jgi:2-polyprenyl-3-methyl-5-hydroxy-6-metoxy-1,4-benzoquinol methylase
MCHTAIATEDALTERLFGATIQTLELFGVYLGKRLGLYTALKEHGALTPAGLAETAKIAERYAREWLEQQAVAGLLVVEGGNGDAATRRYGLPAEHENVLADDDHPAHVAPFAQMVVGVACALPEVVEAYRSGAGVPYERYGSDFRQGQGGINRPAFVNDLTGSWLPSIADLHARLSDVPGVRIADVGCGEGWSTIALAECYGQADVFGYDLDEASVVTAAENAAQRGVDARFVCKDASRMAEDGPFDLILLLEALHDMSQPTAALAGLRGALAPGGSVVVADERVAEEFTAPGDEVERMMYGWSISHCLPSAMADQPSAAIGTAIRPDTVRTCATDAGFLGFEVLPIENDLFRFYRLQA